MEISTVWHAISTLAQEGKPITNRGVRSITGGSNRDVSTCIKALLEGEMVDAILDLEKGGTDLADIAPAQIEAEWGYAWQGTSSMLARLQVELRDAMNDA